ncbi:DUF262 domain-containing protein [Hydrogenophilus thermoluteolus]|nr:DUF262 domain-containing protein [Hydrogenophilus thermoluteolus]MBW7657758.1 DUF262 domain-containing protein [Hydrogenophilus thermoluteolus]
MNDTENPQKPTGVKTDILKIGEVLKMNISLPDYQRPYKWQSEHVRQLMSDLRDHRGKHAYRLGSFVFHEYKKDGQDRLDIVDGQQRLVTLLLIVSAIQQKAPALIKPECGSLLDLLHFEHEKSRENIARNYQEIRNALGTPDQDFVNFLLETCEVVCFTLTDVSEAFQFFDSQNARGKPLDPHDLLKAYHLREFNPSDQHLKAETVKQWEAIEERDTGKRDTELKHLFGEYLYRIRQWSRGHSAGQFRNRDIGAFKGINPESAEGDLPHLRALKMAHYVVDDYNAHFSRRIDRQAMTYPFSLDQTILNGRRFFEMVMHYQRQGFHRSEPPEAIRSSKIIEVLDRYDGRERTGDRHVRNLFNCLLMMYYDKFGSAEVERAIKHIFVWAYTLRLENYAVQWASIENHVRDDNRFMTLRNSCRPEDFLNHPNRPLKKIGRNIADFKGFADIFPKELIPQAQATQ